MSGAGSGRVRVRVEACGRARGRVRVRVRVEACGRARGRVRVRVRVEACGRVIAEVDEAIWLRRCSLRFLHRLGCSGSGSDRSAFGSHRLLNFLLRLPACPHIPVRGLAVVFAQLRDEPRFLVFGKRRNEIENLLCHGTIGADDGVLDSTLLQLHIDAEISRQGKVKGNRGQYVEWRGQCVKWSGEEDT